LAQLRGTCNEILAKDFDPSLRVDWIPIEWHSLLHQMETVDESIKKITLPTCSVLRMVNNDVLSDVLYYFTTFHGQSIIDIVVSQLNQAFAGFLKKYVQF
jgi:hypothetical protein